MTELQPWYWVTEDTVRFMSQGEGYLQNGETVQERVRASVSWENEMLYLCNVIQKEKSHTDLTDLTDLLSLQATVLTMPHRKKLRRSKNP
jgi:hypothetical protein